MTLKYRRNPFNEDAAWAALRTVAEQQAPASPEREAIHASTIAMLFIFAPPRWFRNEEGRVVASIEELLLDMERGHTYVAYLAPWVEEVKRRATEEQRQFLQDVGLDGVQEEDTGSACSIGSEEEQEASSSDEPETPFYTGLFPEPAQALSLLETLAQRYDPSTVGHTCLELAVQTLRFLIENGQADALSAYLKIGEQPHTPTREERPALA